MKYNVPLLLIILTIFSCSKDDATLPPCSFDTTTPTGNNSNEISIGKTLDQGNLFNECVSIENITSTVTDFVILNKGLQEEGKAKGIKINEAWESSAKLNYYNSNFSILTITYWFPPSPINSTVGELMSFGALPVDNPVGCYYLTSNESTADSIQCSYSMHEDDITLVEYKLDESKENKLEIIEYDHINGIIKAKMKASFITDEPAAPDFPERVRFFNVDIETY